MASKYKLLEANKENPYLSTIEKSGVKVEFTIDYIWGSIRKSKRDIEKIKQELAIKKALMGNVEHTHGNIIKIVKGEISISEAINAVGEDFKFPPDAITAIYLWREASGYATIAEDKILELEIAIKEDERTVKEACEALKIQYPVDIEFKKAETKEEKVEKIVTAPVAEEPKAENTINEEKK